MPGCMTEIGCIFLISVPQPRFGLLLPITA